jgi:hypothetical protein
MSKETFKGLDDIILDQPEFIDLNEEVEKLDEDKDDKSESVESKKDDKTKEVNSKKELITIENDEEEEEEIDETIENSTKESTQEETIKKWGEFFKENELLTDDELGEDFDGSQENLIEAFKKREIRVGLEMVDDYKSQLPSMIKLLADNWEEGVPLTELLNIKSNQIRYANITDEKIEESEETQKAVYSEYLRKTTKYSDSKIEKEVKRLVELDELKDEAKDVLKELKSLEAEAEETIRRETKKEQDERKEANKKAIQTYEKIAKSTKEVIPGLKIDDKIQEDVLKKVINPIGIDGNGNPVSYINSIRNENPYEFDIKLNYLMVITKGLTDFSKITNTASTKVTKELGKALEIGAPKGKNNISTTGKKSVLEYLALPQNKK